MAGGAVVHLRRRRGRPGLGDLTIRWNPGEGWLEVRLPATLEHLANRPHGRYRLAAPVAFPYRGQEVTAQPASGAVRYDISYEPGKDRWYLDASWTFPTGTPPGLKELRQHPVLAVDVLTELGLFARPLTCENADRRQLVR